MAAWYDTSSLPIGKELIQKGLISANDTPWSFLASSSPVFAIKADEDIGLTKYFDMSMSQLETYDRTKKFVGVPHLLEIEFPTLAPEEQTIPDAAPGEVYRFQVGEPKFLHWVESTPITVEPPHCSIYPFMHLTAEDFFYTGGTITIPSMMGKKLIQISDEETFYADGQLHRAADLEHLDPQEYPIAHLCGRKYLVCDALGAYYIVEV